MSTMHRDKIRVPKPHRWEIQLILGRESQEYGVEVKTLVCVCTVDMRYLSD